MQQCIRDGSFGPFFSRNGTKGTVLFAWDGTKETVLFAWDGAKGNVSHLFLLDESAQS